MPWPWSSPPSSRDKGSKSAGSDASTVSWNDSLDVKDWDHFKDPRTWIPAFVITTVLLGGLKLYRTYLRRIPSVNYVLPHHYHKRTLFGRVTSVGDGDGFHLYHTPGGRLAGWGWLRSVPTDRKQLKGQTVRFFFFFWPGASPPSARPAADLSSIDLDSHPTRRHRCPRGRALWPSLATVRLRSTPVAPIVHTQSLRARTRLQARPI